MHRCFLKAPERGLFFALSPLTLGMDRARAKLAYFPPPKKKLKETAIIEKNVF